MRKMAENDEGRRLKLAELEDYDNNGDECNNNGLGEFVDLSDALTRSPRNAVKLRKCKSMVKKSKSVIVTAKDIPMNAFMAMKGAAAEKDEKWLRGFLSESVVEEVPWECSKALIITKDGFQVRWTLFESITI